MRVFGIEGVGIGNKRFDIQKSPIIHKVVIDGGHETVCGVKFPYNTTYKDEFVTCNKCKRIIRNKNG